ncbi:MAG: hypothetical protein HY360_04015 [Verrucomicrobia bacterium]|nr:hypothetical protein [Verrucomicrobiota bacterium]
MYKKHLAMVSVLFLLNTLPGVSLAQVQVSPAELRERGVLFYAPFDGSTKALFSVGSPTPWMERDILYAPGVFGQGVQFVNKPARQVKMADGSLAKYINAQSILAYEALGNIYRRRGTISFWVLSPWDASDQNILTGFSLSGPSVIGISAKDIYTPFFEIYRWKAEFRAFFGGNYRQGTPKEFGSRGRDLIPRWKGNAWQHVAITWDDRRGFAIYHNGDLIDKYEGDIVWDLFKPDTIALGSTSLRFRNLFPVNSEYVFDEFLIFNRPLAQEEISMVKNGKYTELRPTQPADWPSETEARRRDLHFGEMMRRPVVHADKKGARVSIRQIAVEDVSMKFHLGSSLLDGKDDSSVAFEDGGLPFDVPATFRFIQPGKINHAVVNMGESKGTYLFGKNADENLGTLTNGINHLPLPVLPRNELGIFFKGRSEAKEVGFFDIGTNAEAQGRKDSGEALYLTHPVQVQDLKEAGDVLLGALHPLDQPALFASRNKSDSRHSLKRKAMYHTFLVTCPAEKERFVDSILIVLQIKPNKTNFIGRVQVHDPQIKDKVALNMDIAFEWPESDLALPLEMRLSPPGLIIPKGGELAVDIILDTDFEIEYGASAESRLEIKEGDPDRIGHEFALSVIRNLAPAFKMRLQQNRFLYVGEEKEKNPIWQGLTLAEKYDPGNKFVKPWFGWSRFRPWAAYNFSHLDRQPAPSWAVYLREAARSMQAILHWWLDHRSNPDGYIVGAGNQWNDITDFYSVFMSLGATVSDARFVNAVERYLDSHWNSGRMSGGYYCGLTDITHSLEEATEIQPQMEVLRPGVPRHIYRNLLTAGNYGKWLGTNGFGHTHFRSNFFNADRLIPTGVQGRDLPACAGAISPGQILWWYNGHPPTAKVLTRYADSWLDDTLRETKTKPRGAIPGAVQFETDDLSNEYGAKTCVAETFLSAYSLTGDSKYLEPVKILLQSKGELGEAKWASHYSRNFLHCRILTGDATSDDALREIARESYELLKTDSTWNRGIEAFEGTLLLRWVVDFQETDLMEMLKFVVKNNRRSFPIYTEADPPTDRVYPWGCEILPVVMLGGRVFGERAFMPVPSAAFVWDGTDVDVVSMVFEHKPTSLKMLVYNFKSEAVNAGIRVMRLPEGKYRLATAMDANGDRKPDGEPEVKEITLRRHAPATIPIPAKKVLWVELSLIEERSRTIRPDLAVTLAKPSGNDRKVVAEVHNLGCAPASNLTIRLVGSDGKKLAEETLSELPGLTGYEPQIKEVTLNMPDDAKAETCALVVDPDNHIDEINESNNGYPLSKGVPPPVETPPKK